jgi:hypothetical protein
MPLSFAEFADEAPELAAAAEMLFDRYGLVLLGTVRSDGSPRISPVEPVIVDGELCLGLMPVSLKTRDLERDPRCTVHSVVADRLAPDGEFKLHGRAETVEDLHARQRYSDALYQKIGWAPGITGYALFAVRIRSAALFTTLEHTRVVQLWRMGESTRRFYQGMDGCLEPTDEPIADEPTDS